MPATTLAIMTGVLPLRPTCTLWKDLMKSCMILVIIVRCATSTCVTVTHNTSNYRYCTDLSTRLGADIECTIVGLRLLVLETSEEFDFWAKKLEAIRSSSTWVGAMCNSTYNDYVWDNTQTPVPASFFSRETTPSHTADCVSFRLTTLLLGLFSGPYKLDIADCSSRKSYICEEKPLVTTTTKMVTTTEVETTEAVAITTEAETTPTVAITTDAETTANVATTTEAETTANVAITTEAETTANVAITTEAETTATAAPITTIADISSSLPFTTEFETTTVTTAPDFTTNMPTIDGTSTVSTPSAFQPPTTAPITTLTTAVTTTTATTTQLSSSTTKDLTTFPTETITKEADKSTQPVTSSTPLPDSTTAPLSSIASVLAFNTSVLCVCGCHIDIPRGAEEKAAFVEEQKNKIHTELNVDKETLSSTTRKKISSEDNRPSVTFVGYAGVAFICAILGSMLLVDMTRCATVVEKIKMHSFKENGNKVTENVP